MNIVFIIEMNVALPLLYESTYIASYILNERHTAIFVSYVLRYVARRFQIINIGGVHMIQVLFS